jgi:hypothetical protein
VGSLSFHSCHGADLMFAHHLGLHAVLLIGSLSRLFDMINKTQTRTKRNSKMQGMSYLHWKSILYPVNFD